VGHHPIYSLGHGSQPYLKTYVEPLLYKYNVSVWMNGHDHLLQHFIANNINGTIDSSLPHLVQYFASGAGHGVEQPVNFSSLSPDQYAPYIPAFNANQFLWPPTNSYTSAELVPNQDTLPRTEPDSGSDRGGFMGIELSYECLCSQWFDSFGALLYVTATPNLRVDWTSANLSLLPEQWCNITCAVFDGTPDTNSGRSWYEDGAILAGVLVGIVVALAVGVRVWGCRKRSQPLDSTYDPDSYDAPLSIQTE